MGILERLIGWAQSLDPGFFPDLKTNQDEIQQRLVREREAAIRQRRIDEEACNRDRFSSGWRSSFDRWDSPGSCRYFQDLEPETAPVKAEIGTREFFGMLAAPFFWPKILIDGKLPDPIGEIESLLEFFGISRGLRALGEVLEQGSASRKERLKNLEENGIHVSEAEVAEKIAEKLRGELKDIRITLKDGQIILHAVYSTKLIDLNVEGVIDLSVRNGKVDSEVKKFEVGGLDKRDLIKEKLIEHLRREGKSVPDNAELKDLSWMDSMGIKTLVIQDGRILVELFDPPSGPS